MQTAELDLLDVDPFDLVEDEEPFIASVAASADTAMADLLDRALRIIAEFEKPSRRKPVRANRKPAVSVDAALATLRTLRTRLSGALLKELDGIIASLVEVGKVAAKFDPGQLRNEKGEWARTGTLGSVLDQLGSLRDKLSDDDRSTLDRAMDQLRGLESSDVDDDDLNVEEPDDDDEDDEDDEERESSRMDSDVGELDFIAYLDGNVDIDWEDGEQSIRLGPAAQTEIADAVARFTKLPVEARPEVPDFPTPPNAKEMTEKEFFKWHGDQMDDWYRSPEYLHYNRIVGEMTTGDGEHKVVRQANGSIAIGAPADIDDEDRWEAVIQLADGEQADEFVEMLRRASESVQASAPPSRRRAVVAHLKGMHDQKDHGRKGLPAIPKAGVAKPAQKKAAPEAKPAPAKKAATPRKAAPKAVEAEPEPKAAAPKAPARKRAAPKASFAEITPGRAKAMQSEMLSQQGWTAEHTRSYKAWTTSGFHDIRMMIDNPDHEPFLGIGGRATVKQHIRNMHAGMRPLPQPVKVFRKADPQGVGLKPGEDPKSLVGRKMQNANFTAASILPDGGFLGAERPIHVEIDVPAGTPAAYLEDLTETQGEHELLLDAGLAIEYVSARKRRDGVIVLKARVIS